MLIVPFFVPKIRGDAKHSQLESAHISVTGQQKKGLVMSEQQWKQAWIDTGYAATMYLKDFQDAVMLGSIKLKWVKRPIEKHSH